MSAEFVLDAGSDEEIDLSDETRQLRPTTDVDHSILEPMKIEPLKLPQFKIDEMMASYDDVCLNDFRDIYHMSEEDRKQTFQYYEVFKKLRTVKTKHRIVSSYIEAMRVRMEALEKVAETNGIYSKEEFIEKVLKGKITVVGLKKPKYIGRGKKDLNWDIISEYICDLTKDPKDLDKKSNTAYYDLVEEEDIDDYEDFLGMSVIDYINSTDSKESRKLLEEMDFDETDTVGNNVVTPMTKKEQKRLIKDHREVLFGLKETKKDINAFRSGNLSKTFAWQLTQDAFLEIEEMDEETGRLKVPEFKGNIFKKSDYHKYLAVLDEFQRKNTFVEINNRTYTLEEAEEIELKNMLEANGYDIRKFYNYAKDEKKMRLRRKQDKKKLEKLKKRLRDAKERYEERESKGKVNTKKKKQGKKAKKKSKDLDKKFTPGGYDNFDEYAKMMEGWND